MSPTSALLTILTSLAFVKCQAPIHPNDRFSDFDWNLTKSVCQRVQDNVVISPISLKMVLAILYQGSRGNTSKQLEQALHLVPGGKAYTSSHFANIRKSLEEPSDAYELDIGTKLFIAKDTQLITKYQQDIETLYNASIQRLDFGQTKEAVSVINKWAEEVTKGKINDLVTEADATASTILLLVNALFFNGLWEKPFSRNETREDSFYTSRTEKVRTEFMNSVHFFQYTESPELNCSIVRLPYHGNKFAMYIILPDEMDGLERIIQNISPNLLQRLLPTMEESQVQVSLPKFKFDFAATLKPVLLELGIVDLFNINADLTEIAKSPTQHLLVTDVIQKAGIELNEEGSQAYAATHADLDPKFGEHVVHFKANRPFAFYIEDDETKTVVFVGKVMNPQSAGNPKVTLEKDTPSVAPINNLNERIKESNSKPSEVSPPPLSTPFLPAEPVCTTCNNQEVVPDGGYVNSNGEYVYQMFNHIRLSFFDTEIVRSLCNSEPGNWVVSTASIKTILSMIYEGSALDTETQLAKVLRLSENKTVGLQQVHSLQRELHSRVDRTIDWVMANRVLVSKELPLVPDYKLTMQRKFRATVDNYDFVNPQTTAQDVNEWVKSLTRGLITELIDPGTLQEKPSMVLLNAVYFKGGWEHKFNEKFTQESCFYVTPGDCKMVPMMRQQAPLKYGYLKPLNAHVVELPYTSSRFSMVLIVPAVQGGLTDVVRNLPYNPILSSLADLEQIELTIIMPKFTIDFSKELNNIIYEMGAKDMFTEKADLRNMIGNRRGKISKIIHKAKIIVNEEGSEAGAGTAGLVVPLMIGSRPVVLEVNQPFIFYIRDSHTGFLFAGQVSNPLN